MKWRLQRVQGLVKLEILVFRRFPNLLLAAYEARGGHKARDGRLHARDKLACVQNRPTAPGDYPVLSPSSDPSVALVGPAAH